MPITTKQKKLWRYLAVLLTLFAGSAWHSPSTSAQTDTTFARTPWKMHRGDGILELDAVLPSHGNPEVYN